MIKYKYSRHEGYEVSSKGDSRFSALFAQMPDGRTIEMHYQCDKGMKGYDHLGVNWRLGKGKPPVDKSITPDMLYDSYLGLWKIWANNNPELIEELKFYADNNGFCLRDSFAVGPINQARALSQILNEKYA